MADIELDLPQLDVPQLDVRDGVDRETIETVAAMGAYLSAFGPGVPTVAAAGLQVGCYTIPVMHIETKCVFTNTTPVDAYRGAGRPEAASTRPKSADRKSVV